MCCGFKFLSHPQHQVRQGHWLRSSSYSMSMGVVMSLGEGGLSPPPPPPRQGVCVSLFPDRKFLSSTFKRNGSFQNAAYACSAFQICRTLDYFVPKSLSLYFSQSLRSVFQLTVEKKPYPREERGWQGQLFPGKPDRKTEQQTDMNLVFKLPVIV